MMENKVSSAPLGDGSAATAAPSREEPATQAPSAPPGDGSAATAAPSREEPATQAPSTPPGDGSAAIDAIEGPVWVAWREGTLTRAKELEALSLWVRKTDMQENDKVLATAIDCHLTAARQAAKVVRLDPRRRFRIFRNGPLIERARGNLDAAEAHLLTLASNDYILGQMPSLLNHVQVHLLPTDARRQEFERIAQKLGIKDPDHPLLQKEKELSLQAKKAIVHNERRKIINIVRAASSAGLREHIRLRSFRNVVVITAGLMAVLAIGVALTGLLRPTLIPMCFAPQESGKVTVVCPTAQSEPFVPTGGQPQSGVPTRDIDNVVEQTAKPLDLTVVELVGLTAAAIATAAAIRRLKGSSERYGLPVSLAALKLPTGAITAFLGLLLMRGQFVPGLSALDTSAQILAWALVFGYAQQLFTRLVDQQGQTVLDNVRGADRPELTPSPS
jgi:hypothetical protein